MNRLNEKLKIKIKRRKEKKSEKRKEKIKKRKKKNPLNFFVVIVENQLSRRKRKCRHRLLEIRK